MSSCHVVFRRLLLTLAAFGTLAMHTGLTGACAGPMAGAHLIAPSAAMTHVIHTGQPAMPQDVSHGVDLVCQARLPPASPGAAGPSAVLALIAPFAVTGPLARPLLLAAPARWPPPPERSSLGVWRM